MSCMSYWSKLLYFEFSSCLQEGTAKLVENSMCLACVCIARPCHKGLIEACLETALPCRKVVRWIRVLNKELKSTVGVTRPGRPSVNEEQIRAVVALLDTDQRQNT